jgi:uncharacterized protein
MLSDLDGFLTGMACSPTLIKGWQSLALGDVTQVPDDIMQLVSHRLSAIAEGLARPPGQIEPVFWQASEGHVIAMDWCEGFMEAVKRQPNPWDAFGQSRAGARLMMPILVHMFDDDGNSLFGLAQEDIDETLEAAAAAIPQVVPSIYWKLRAV